MTGWSRETFVNTGQVSQLFLGHRTLFESELWTPACSSVEAGRPAEPQGCVVGALLPSSLLHHMVVRTQHRAQIPVVWPTVTHMSLGCLMGEVVSRWEMLEAGLAQGRCPKCRLPGLTSVLLRAPGPGLRPGHSPIVGPSDLRSPQHLISCVYICREG